MLGFSISLLLLAKTLTIDLEVGQKIKLQSVNKPNHFLSRQSSSDQLIISDSGTDNVWIVKSGLIGEGNTISLESASEGFIYIRIEDLFAKVHFWLDQTDKELYKKDASFTTVNGVAGEGIISLTPYKSAGYLLRHHDGNGMKIELSDGTDEYNQETSFKVEVIEPPGESMLRVIFTVLRFESILIQIQLQTSVPFKRCCRLKGN